MIDRPTKEIKDRDLNQVSGHSEAEVDKECKRINIKMALTDNSRLSRREVLKGKNIVIEALFLHQRRKSRKMNHTSRPRFALSIKR